MEPRNRFQGINSASLCSLAGRYDNPIPTRLFLAPIYCLKISVLAENVILPFSFGRRCKKQICVFGKTIKFPETATCHRFESQEKNRMQIATFLKKYINIVQCKLLPCRWQPCQLYNCRYPRPSHCPRKLYSHFLKIMMFKIVFVFYLFSQRIFVKQPMVYKGEFTKLKNIRYQGEGGSIK